MPKCVRIHYLEMRNPLELRPRDNPDAGFQIHECTFKQGRFNRFLYELVGHPWQWTDKLQWSSEAWSSYAEADDLRTWVGYRGGSPAGYYELRRSENGEVQIAYFGLAPIAIGQGLGGYLLSHALKSAWDWDARRVWVHTCDLDHPYALANYQSRGMRVYKVETRG